jgi:hypothetical protein
MSDLLRHVLQSGVCLVFFYGAYCLFLKKETYFFLNRMYLLSSMLLAFVIPAIHLPSPLLTVPAGGWGASPVYPLTAAPRHIHGGEIAMLVYLAGVLLFLARFLLHLAKLHRIVRQNGIRFEYDMRVVSVDREFSPFSFLNVVFFNDRNINADNLQRILAHERVHIQQHHSLDILLMELVIAIQWFNPFVWPYKKSLQETHEYLADEGVIAQGFSVTMYRLLVFEQHVGAGLFELANNFKQSQIKRRLTMMSKIKSKSAARLKLLLGLPLAMFLVLAFADPRPVSRTGGPTGLAPQEKADPKIQRAVSDLELLREKEAKLREKLDSAPTPEAKQEMKKQLETVLKKQQEIQTYLSEAGHPVVLKKAQPGGQDFEAEYRKIQEEETVLRDKIKATTDAAVKAELESALARTMEKEVQIKALEAAGGASDKLQMEKLKQEYTLLEQKKQEVRVELEKTENPQKKAELEDMLKKITQKQEQIKVAAEAIKAGAEAKKAAQEEKE